MPGRRKSVRGDRRRSALLQSTIDETEAKTDFTDAVDEEKAVEESPRKRTRRTSSSVFETIPPTLPEGKRLEILVESLIRRELFALKKLSESSGDDPIVTAAIEEIVDQFLERLKEAIKEAMETREKREKEEEKKVAVGQESDEENEVKHLQRVLRQYEQELNDWTNIVEEARSLEREKDTERGRIVAATVDVDDEVKGELENSKQLQDEADTTIMQTLKLLGRKFDAMHRIVKAHSGTETEAARLNQDAIQLMQKIGTAEFEAYIQKEKMLL